MFYYACTFRKVRKPFTLSLLEEELAKVKGKVLDPHYEDTKGLHVHFILESEDPERPIYRKRGWYFYAVPIWYTNGWIRYMSKDDSDDVYTRHQQIELHENAPYPHDQKTSEGAEDTKRDSSDEEIHDYVIDEALV